MTTFERRIAPMKVRIEGVERQESALAERARSASARSADVVKSIDLLTSQFPDVEVRDPSDGKWALQPLSARLNHCWNARRTTIVETESPALAKAAESAMAEAGSIDVQRSSLVQRTEGARRSRIADGSGSRPTAGWARVFRNLAYRCLKKQSLVGRSVKLEDALRRVAELAETGQLIEQRQMELQSLASELQRMKQVLDELEAHLIE